MALALALATGLVLAAASGAARAEGPPLQGKFGERFTVKESPKPAPDVTFQDREGNPVSLADFKGQVVLVNFWATWCAPCIEEMPTLDALEAELGGPGFRVIAVSQDVGGREQVEPFLREKLDLSHLGIYLDPQGELGRAFGMRGLPTTYLIDAEGRVVGGLEGPADWNGPAVHALIEYYLEQGREAGVIETGG